MIVQAHRVPTAVQPHTATVGHSPKKRPGPDTRQRNLAALVVDAHPLFGDLLAGSLAGRFQIDMVAMASSSRDAAEACAVHRPDLVIINPPLADAGWLSILPAAAAANPAVRIVLFGDSAAVPAAFDKAVAPDHIAVVDRSSGLRGLFDEITNILMSLGRAPAALSAEERLSRREMDVFTGIGRGLSSADIATELGISIQTVETHRKGVVKKLGATGAELVRIAVLHVAANGGSS